MTLTEMRERLAALQEMRWRGVRETSWEGRRVVYGSDAELAAAILDLERRIEALAAEGRPRRVRRPWAVKDL